MCRIFRVPDLSVSDDYDLIIKHLIQYQKQGDNKQWDEYRLKIPPELAELWMEIVLECRRNGFIGPYVYSNKLLWKQVLRVGLDNGDLCTMCEKECSRREYVDRGEAKMAMMAKLDFKSAQVPCWED